MLTQNEKEAMLDHLEHLSTACGENSWLLYTEMKKYISGMEAAPQDRSVTVRWEKSGEMTRVLVPRQMPLGSIKAYLEALYREPVMAFQAEDWEGVHVYTPDGVITVAPRLDRNELCAFIKLEKDGLPEASTAFVYNPGKHMTEPIIRAGWELQGKYLVEGIIWKASEEKKKELQLPREAAIPAEVVGPSEVRNYLEGMYGAPVISYRRASPEGFRIYTPAGAIDGRFSFEEPRLFLTCKRLDALGSEDCGPSVLIEYTEDPGETAKGPRVHALVWTREDPDGESRFDLNMSPGEDG